MKLSSNFVIWQKLKAPLGKVIEIESIETFSLEENCDFVKIYDGSTSSGKLLAQLTGYLTKINSIISTDNTIQIKFTRLFYLITL